MKGKYPEVENKMWLALQSSKGAKSYAVYDYGIGEEIPFTLLGWVDDCLAMVCQINDPTASKMKRFEAIYQAAIVLRRGWACTSFTFIAEGFCITDRTRADMSTPLAQQFADGNTAVAECLTFMHSDIDYMHILMVPYRYGLGRSVSYADPIKYPDRTDSAYAFPRLLQKSLGFDADDLPEDRETFYATLVDGLEDMGVDCQWWDILER
jgi:hypothetical protein